jgi:hypothetical protein
MDLHLQAAKLDKQWLRQAAADLLPSPLTLDVIARLAAVGITHDAWRCGPVEDWHSAGRMTDGQMMRITSLTSWEVEGHIDEWCADLGLEPDASFEDLDAIGLDKFEILTVDVLCWITDPTRVLANYQVLAEIASDAELHDLVEHAEGVFAQLVEAAEDFGVAHAFLGLAVNGSRMKWWGTPGWIARVETFMAAVHDRGHPHWRGGAHMFPESWPEPAEDHPRLKELLLEKPWDLGDDTAQWAIRHGINYVVVDR